MDLPMLLDWRPPPPKPRATIPDHPITTDEWRRLQWLNRCKTDQCRRKERIEAGLGDLAQPEEGPRL